MLHCPLLDDSKTSTLGVVDIEASGANPASKLRGDISVILVSQVSQQLRYCKRDEVCFTKQLRQNNRRWNGLISRMLFSELYKNHVNEATFVGFRGQSAPWIDPCEI